MATGRDTKVRFERLNATARNAFNEPVPAWELICQAWVQKVDLSDVEAVSAGHQGSARVARFTVRSSTKTRTIVARDRMVIKGQNWNITGVVDGAKGRRRTRVLTAVLDSENNI